MIGLTLFVIAVIWASTHYGIQWGILTFLIGIFSPFLVLFAFLIGVLAIALVVGLVFWLANKD